MLCTSGFMDDVMLAHIDQEQATQKGAYILKLIHQGAAPDRERSLIFTVALFSVENR